MVDGRGPAGVWPAHRLHRGASVHGLQLKREDWTAACELFEQQPHLGDALDRDALAYYAHQHAANGLRAFRLQSGPLEPDGPVAVARRRLDCGEISRAEFDAVLEARLRRPPDEAAMIAFYENLWERANQVAGLMLRLDERFESEPNDEPWVASREASFHLAAAQQPHRVMPQELEAADNFARDVRIGLGIPPAEYGPHCEVCAGALVREVTLSLLEFLRPGPDGRVTVARLKALYDQCELGVLPNPNKLRAAVEHERAAVLMLFRKGAAAPAPEPAGPPPAVSGPIGSEPAPGQLLIADWSHLVIGVDKAWGYHAITPVPDLDAEIPKTTPLDLRRRDWRPVFELAAESPGGHSAPLVELVRRLDAFPEVVSALGSEIEACNLEDRIAGLDIGGRQLFEKNLRPKLNRLRSELRGLIRVSSGDDELLAVHREAVETGFVVRYLTTSTSGKTHFVRSPPTSPGSPEERV